MTKRFSRSRILLQTGIVAWLIIGTILLLQLVLSVSQPESALGACIRSGVAAAIAGAVIFFFTRRPLRTRLLGFSLYVILVGATLPFALIYAACAFFRNCP
jgi:hypothetical protein